MGERGARELGGSKGMVSDHAGDGSAAPQALTVASSPGHLCAQL